MCCQLSLVIKLKIIHIYIYSMHIKQYPMSAYQKGYYGQIISEENRKIERLKLTQIKKKRDKVCSRILCFFGDFWFVCVFVCHIVDWHLCHIFQLHDLCKHRGNRSLCHLLKCRSEFFT